MERIHQFEVSAGRLVTITLPHMPITHEEWHVLASAVDDLEPPPLPADEPMHCRHEELTSLWNGDNVDTPATEVVGAICLACGVQWAFDSGSR